MTHPDIFTGYLIDPFNQSITGIWHGGEIHEIYTLLGGVELFDFVKIDNDHCLYVDDAGLFVDPSIQRYFHFDNILLAGKGLVLGTDNTGDATSPQIAMESIVRRIRFPEHARASAVARFLISEINRETVFN